MTEFIFCTGMFRSGTTLLARLLNAHPEIAIASDPFGPVFKAFRNSIASSIDYDIDPEAPLNDYYFSTREMRLFDAVQKASSDLPLDGWGDGGLKSRVVNEATHYSPLIVPLINEMDIGSFSSTIRTGVDVIRQAYGNQNTKLVGFKATWTGEFVPHLLRTFPKARVLYIVRDPRAVCASKNVQSEKYPWLFLTRQWRKLAAFAWYLENCAPDIASRICVMRYEDLVRDPANTIQGICDFLKMPFSEEMIDPTNYKDGSGNKWVQNSTFQNKKQTFNASSINKWREVLGEHEIRYIESMCYWEMSLFGYDFECIDSDILDLDMFLDPPVVADGNYTEWIRKYCITNEKHYKAECALDYARHEAIRNNLARTEDQKRYISLFSEVYDFCSIG